ncbi:tyrosine-protein kinase STYK1 [Archocentrus centrarchus]|uniref:tyrosine-protein kinase STYK1 n=1 Tax=Archocentrus centrarchus TaxID=63155 RepID=UPI0011E9B3F0|nr:tyrosine-protein kinase STYK1-like [Archocentrus centrarchus]XP_030596703.1 tyrosine-protein kinase STYK1-like [Archocentrus centrarchus]
MSNSTGELCAQNDTICTIREHQPAVIIVPTLLLLSTLVTLVPLFILKYCGEQNRTRVRTPQQYQRSSHRHTQRKSHHSNNHHKNHNHRPHLSGIDAPPGINPLEHEELPMSVTHVQQNVGPTMAAVPQRSTERHLGAFSQVTTLPLTLFINDNDTVSFYRARMDNKDAVLRVLKESATSREKQQFLGFASFVSGLGPHPFIPALLGVISAQSPLVMVVEELQHRDLLGFLWRCRQDNSSSQSSCDMTEKRIFTMAAQVASALDYLHSQSCIHGNVGARSVLIGGDLTAKLWGFGPAYRRRSQAGLPGEVEAVEMKKWQAPEVLAMRPVTKSSDVWSFGILIYEMVTLGDPPFPQLMATELLQHLQRGNHLSQPPTCPKPLYSIIRSCCHFNTKNRLSTSELIRTLHAGEKSANGRTVIRVTEPFIFEKYLREAGYGEAYSYAVL